MGCVRVWWTGERWKTRRRLLTPAFHFQILASFFDVFNEQSRALVDFLQEKVQQEAGQAIDIFPVITKCALDIICGKFGQKWKVSSHRQGSSEGRDEGVRNSKNLRTSSRKSQKKNPQKKIPKSPKNPKIPQKVPKSQKKSINPPKIPTVRKNLKKSEKNPKIRYRKNQKNLKKIPQKVPKSPKKSRSPKKPQNPIQKKLKNLKKNPKKVSKSQKKVPKSQNKSQDLNLRTP